MADVYFEVPKNWSAVKDKVTTAPEKIANALLYEYDKVFFYDTCSFRGHSNLTAADADTIISHMKQERGVVVLTKCILMELASGSGELNQEYLDLIFRMTDHHGMEVIVMKEEDMLDVMLECFSTIRDVNTYLMWAVRMLGVPTSTIEITLAQDGNLNKKIKEGKGLGSRELFSDFFSSVRKNKVSSDNLGEELLAICVQILSHIPGLKDYRFNVLTEDKGARAVIHNLLYKTGKQYAGQKVMIYSTPRLLQTMIHLGRISDPDSISRILGMGQEREIAVYGTLPEEFETTKHTYCTGALAQLMLTPDKIDIRF